MLVRSIPSAESSPAGRPVAVSYTHLVDGQNLPKLADAQTNSAAGWNADRAGSRLVIHLPAAPAGASRKIEVDFVPDEASARK